MKKVSTVVAKQSRNFSQAFTIGLDLGDSQQLVLRAGRSGPDTVGAPSAYECKSVAGRLWRNAAQSHHTGNRAH
jgi:hypothetical protein